MDKKEWRQAILSQREQLSLSEWQQKSKNIHSNLFQSMWWHHSKHIALYHSFDKEVDTIAIMEAAWQSNKKVYLPKSEVKTKQLHFYHVQSSDDIVQGAYGIPEPNSNICSPFEIGLNKLDWILVPGLVFERTGFRVGYGGGYYDRFLPMLDVQVDKISFAFSFQVTNQQLPRNKYDQPVNAIVTENGVIYCK